MCVCVCMCLGWCDCALMCVFVCAFEMEEGEVDRFAIVNWLMLMGKGDL